MTKDVLITVRGSHHADGVQDEAPVVTRAHGKYYKKDGTHYLFYEEKDEKLPKSTKNSFRMTEEELVVRKSGLIETEMLFHPGQKNKVSYTTPLGTVDMEITGQSFQLSESEDRIVFHASYILESGGYREVCGIEAEILPDPAALPKEGI